ncbi:TATA box-binding protein-associated factor RNA polymerase I subunit B isoform X1 [Microplitis mediator]|uniref:TATA box-binding protein-associated factor RNA polymerase I subunit B isoform X1 n=1 Tax=Microplitis mediator TaxID=375433 RepID=UPI0025523009|nr:TATA box-binding protein-associated factor RNA polymerase I subunit B isoform X1 [Microplitis mediator]
MDKCNVCGGTEFYTEAGFYFCQECQTQQEGRKEQDVEFKVDSSTRLRKTKLQRKKRGPDERFNEKSLTSWEKYNYVLIGLTNELIQLGVTTDIKLTVAQLWATYLGKLEAAFTSTQRVAIPKLPRRFDKNDANIIYGRINHKKKKKKSKRGSGSETSGSTMIDSNVSEGTSVRNLQKQKRLMMEAEYKSLDGSNTDGESGLTNLSMTSRYSDKSNTPVKPPRLQFTKLAREETKKAALKSQSLPKSKKKKFRATYCSYSYTRGPDLITPMKLWAILYLALRIHNENIHLSDMLRFARDGYLSYYKLDHFIPADCSFTPTEISKLNQSREITHKGLRQAVARIKKFLQVWKFPAPNLLTLIKQYCTELQLPSGIALYAERILAAWPPKMNFNVQSNYIFPCYEARAMAIIIVTMKILFGLDGVTENEMSRVIERINLVAEEKGVLDSRLFSFREWQRYIECRRCILVNEHFPTKLRHDPHSTGNSHLYIDFYNAVQAKVERDTSNEPKHHCRPKTIFDNMIERVETLTDNMVKTKKSKVFTPSLTPQHSYLQQLLADPDKDFPRILTQDFPSTKVGFIMKPESLKELAAQCDIELNIVDSSAHYVRKAVQVFEPHISSQFHNKRETNDYNEPTRVVTPADLPKFKRSDDPNEYLHRRRPGKIIIETKKQRLYNKMIKLYQENDSKKLESDDFGFDQVFADGKLKIYDNDSSENVTGNVSKLDNILLSNYEKQSMTNPVPNPWEVLKKFRTLDLSSYKSEKPVRRNVKNASEDKENNAAAVADSESRKNDNDAGTVEDIEGSEAIEVSKSPENISEDKENNEAQNNASQEKENEVVVINVDEVELVKAEKSFKIISETLEEEKDLAIIEVDESEPMEVNEVDEITINDESDDSTDKVFNNKSPDKEVVIEDSSDDDEVSILAESIDSRLSANQKDSSATDKELLTLFLPYKQYWLLRASSFDQVVARHYHLLEREFSTSFRWLMHECANIIEMFPEELYKAVWLVESYYTDVLAPDEHMEQCKDYNTDFFRSSSNRTTITKRWNT